MINTRVKFVVSGLRVEEVDDLDFSKAQSQNKTRGRLKMSETELFPQSS